MSSVLEKPTIRRSAPSQVAIESGLTHADLAPTLRPMPEARTLSASLYTSPGVLRLEQEGLFAKMWLCVGREADIPTAGDYFTHQIAGESVIVMRGGDGAVRAFYNVCRHRGARLLDAACGKGLSRVVCPYHAWTYRLDGTLAQVPRMDEGFERESFGLVPVRLGTWAGFIFLNLDAEAEPLETYLADLPDLARFKMEELRLGKRIEYEVAANWKLICENYSECYHCPGVHPQLFRISDHIARHERVQEIGACFNGGPMMLRDGYETMSMSGKRTVPIIEGLKPEDHRFVYYYVIYPNLLLSPHPDYVLDAHRLADRAGAYEDRLRVPVHAGGAGASGFRPDRHGGILGRHEPAGLGSLRARAAWSTVARLPPRALPAERRLRAHLRPLVRGAHGGAALGRALPEIRL